MGFAMLAGWMASEQPPEAYVVEPFEGFRTRAEGVGAQAFASVADLPEGLAPALVILAVKPQMVTPVLAEFAALAATGATFVSVAAGITMPTMAAALPDGAALIRCMPNTPAAVGQGMMVLCAGATASDAAKALTETLLATSGAVAWVDDESLMDAVTAISGSGPAYIFHFIEALTAAGEALGLPSDTAALLAMQTVAGAGRYAQLSEASPTTLREQVTSPNGTTEAALRVFMTDNRLTDLVKAATTAARDRGIELGKGA
jgi:pyrroline-5-carboxylate reductase